MVNFLTGHLGIRGNDNTQQRRHPYFVFVDGEIAVIAWHIGCWQQFRVGGRWFYWWRIAYDFTFMYLLPCNWLASALSEKLAKRFPSILSLQKQNTFKLSVFFLLLLRAICCWRDGQPKSIWWLRRTKKKWNTSACCWTAEAVAEGMKRYHRFFQHYRVCVVCSMVERIMRHWRCFMTSLGDRCRSFSAGCCRPDYRSASGGVKNPLIYFRFILSSNDGWTAMDHDVTHLHLYRTIELIYILLHHWRKTASTHSLIR